MFANVCACIVHSSSAVIAGTASAKLGGVVNHVWHHHVTTMNNAWESCIPYSNPNIYARHRARRRHRDSDLSAPRFHWQSRFPSGGYTHLSDYLPLLPHFWSWLLPRRRSVSWLLSQLEQFVFRSYPGFQMFPGFVSPPESRFRVCLCAICVPRTIRVSASDPVLPRPPGDTHTVHCPGARPIDRIPGV